MRGFSIRLRSLGMCDIIVDHNKVKYLLYHAVLSISPTGISSIWLDISVLLLPTVPRDKCQIGTFSGAEGVISSKGPDFVNPAAIGRFVKPVTSDPETSRGTRPAPKDWKLSLELFICILVNGRFSRGGQKRALGL